MIGAAPDLPSSGGFGGNQRAGDPTPGRRSRVRVICNAFEALLSAASQPRCCSTARICATVIAVDFSASTAMTASRFDGTSPIYADHLTGRGAICNRDTRSFHGRAGDSGDRLGLGRGCDRGRSVSASPGGRLFILEIHAMTVKLLARPGASCRCRCWRRRSWSRFCW